MRVVEVFKTDVYSRDRAAQLLSTLAQRFPSMRISFDLDDCDNILRVEGMQVCPDAIRNILSAAGHSCELLE